MSKPSTDGGKRLGIWPYFTFVGGVVLALTVVANWPDFARAIFGVQSLSEVAQIGDSFGVVNAALTGVAVLFAATAVLLQTRELGLQREELARSSKALVDQGLQLKHQVRHAQNANMVVALEHQIEQGVAGLAVLRDELEYWANDIRDTNRDFDENVCAIALACLDEIALMPKTFEDETGHPRDIEEYLTRTKVLALVAIHFAESRLAELADLIETDTVRRKKQEIQASMDRDKQFHDAMVKYSSMVCSKIPAAVTDIFQNRQALLRLSKTMSFGADRSGGAT